jgi:hypothetical protein
MIQLFLIKDFPDPAAVFTKLFFFVTYKWAGVLHNNRLERLARNKHSSLLGLIR